MFHPPLVAVAHRIDFDYRSRFRDLLLTLQHCRRMFALKVLHVNDPLGYAFCALLRL